MTSPCTIFARHHARQAGRALAKADAVMAEAVAVSARGHGWMLPFYLDACSIWLAQHADHHRTARAWARWCPFPNQEK